MEKRVFRIFSIFFLLLAIWGIAPIFTVSEASSNPPVPSVNLKESADGENAATKNETGSAAHDEHTVKNEEESLPRKNSRAFHYLKEEERQQIDLLAQLTPSLVAIYPVDGSSCGSGVLISDDGFAVTNFHVVQPCGVWMKCGLADGCVYHAVVVGLDPVGDAALIRILPEVQAGRPNLEKSGENEAVFEETGEGKWVRRGFTPAKFGDSNQVRQGDRIWVLGNPFSFEEDFTPSVSSGIVSGTHRYQYPAETFLEYADCIQVDASVNPGNSGGPLFNAAGELIGINGRCSFEKRGRINVGAGYAISINQIRYFLSHLRSGRVVDHATLGATVSSDELGRPVVDEILEDSEAALRGLEIGDRILAFGGRSIQTVNEFKNVLGIFPKGWIVPIEFVRKIGSRVENHRITVRLSGVHSTPELQAVLKHTFGNDMADPNQKPGETPLKPEGNPLPNPPIPEDFRQMMELFKDLKKIPPEIAAVYESREGWVNFYFNRLETKRVWENHSSRSAFHENSSIFRGTNLGGQRFELEMTPEKTLLKQENMDILWENQGDFTRQSLPPESRLLLPGLTIWKEFCEKGPEAFEFTYFGESPLPFTSENSDTEETRMLFDVLEGNVGGVNTRFFFTKPTEPGKPSEIRQMELDILDGGLPWEFKFTRWHQTSQGFLPGKVEIFADGKIFECFQLETGGRK
ncbi:MAG: trypsin-like serine protease [Planctomycetaceae bacterium]|nr:trypsin-like serine protease [Planctomycetaceae bacterium]